MVGTLERSRKDQIQQTQCTDVCEGVKGEKL